jgi:hypothetical protein
MDEKARRKQIGNELREKQRVEFEESLPMGRANFKNLFDYLDIELEENGCDDTTRLTMTFLERVKSTNSVAILNWLADNGIYCNCEILANVEEKFENRWR